jgi:hypothetical protein
VPASGVAERGVVLVLDERRGVCDQPLECVAGETEPRRIVVDDPASDRLGHRADRLVVLLRRGGVVDEGITVGDERRRLRPAGHRLVTRGSRRLVFGPRLYAGDHAPGCLDGLLTNGRTEPPVGLRLDPFCYRLDDRCQLEPGEVGVATHGLCDPLGEGGRRRGPLVRDGRLDGGLDVLGRVIGERRVRPWR